MQKPINSKITKRNDAIGREFWKHAENARNKIAKWPIWKQKIKVTQFSK